MLKDDIVTEEQFRIRGYLFNFERVPDLGMAKRIHAKMQNPHVVSLLSSCPVGRNVELSNKIKVWGGLDGVKCYAGV